MLASFGGVSGVSHCSLGEMHRTQKWVLNFERDAQHDISVSNVDENLLMMHSATTDLMGFHYQELPDQSHVVVLVSRTAMYRRI